MASKWSDFSTGNRKPLSTVELARTVSCRIYVNEDIRATKKQLSIRRFSIPDIRQAVLAIGDKIK